MPDLESFSSRLLAVCSCLKNRLVVAVGVYFCLSLSVRAQMTSEPALSWDDFVNEYLMNTDTDNEIEFTSTDYDALETLSKHPLQVNRTTREALMLLPFLQSSQIDSLLSYRERKNGIRSLGELQLISGWDYYTRRYFSLFARFDSLYIAPAHRAYMEIPWSEKMYKGHHELESYVDVPLYRREGYRKPLHPTPSNHYMGNALKHVVRYRYHYKKDVLYGLTMEKDPGEPVGTKGFYPYDYWSGYVFLQPSAKPWSLVVGDYELAGQSGLVFGRDCFSGREQFDRMHLNRPLQLRPHTSCNEYRYFRGAAFRFRKKHWDALVFASYRKLDARWSEGKDTVRSIQQSGLHRTPAEIERRRTLSAWAAGLHIGWGVSRWGLTYSASFTRFASPVCPEWRTYNAYYFRGQTAGSMSLGYYYYYKKWELQGELAADHALHLAMEQTVRLHCRSNLLFYLQYRQFSPRMVSLYANAIQQNSRLANEQGLMLGAKYLPLPHWELSGYVDCFRYPKPAYRSVLPGAKGIECSIRSRSPFVGSSQLHVRYRIKSRQQTITGYKELEYNTVHRLQIGTLWTWKHFEMNAQLDGTLVTHQTRPIEKGGMISFRTNWKPSGRFCLKDFVGYHWTDNYASALYVYEPLLFHTGAFPSFAYHGLRAVVLADWRIIPGLVLSARVASTRLLNRPVISSGISKIASPWKNDVSLQMRWQF